ncbi:MAG: hypothetical protein HQM15_06935 [Deltaproteobacteria bacterium]|nr:hypothetical protein [Deltaproteobacteria bacterium]
MSNNIPGPGVNRPHTYTESLTTTPLGPQTTTTAPNTSGVPSEILQWAQSQAVPYLQQLSALESGGNLSASELAQVAANRAQVMDELNQYGLSALAAGVSSSWDPTRGNTAPVPGTPAATPLGGNTTPDYMDDNQLVYDGSVYSTGNSFAFQATADKRTVVSYQNIVDLNFPSSSDQIRVTSEPNPAVAGQNQIVVIRHMRDGTDQRYVFPNSNRSDFKLNIHVGSVDQVDAIPAALKSKCKAVVAGDENTQPAPQGTAPTRTENGTYIWDIAGANAKADIYPADLDGEVSVNGTVNMNVNSTRDYVFLSYDATSKQYTYKVCNSNNPDDVKWTAKIDDFRNLKVNLNVDPDHIVFGTGLTDASSPQRIKLQVASGTPTTRAADHDLTPNDTSTTDTSGVTTKVWNTQDTVTLRAGMDDNSGIVYQVDTDALTLRSDNRSQYAVVTKNADGNYKIEVYSEAPTAGRDPDPTKLVRTVNARQIQTMNLQGFAASNVSYSSAPGTAPTSWTSGMDDKIHIGAPGAATTPAVAVQGDDPTNPAGPNGTRVWDGANFNIYTRGDGKTNTIIARGDVQLHCTSNSEYWDVEPNGNSYVIKVYDAAPNASGHFDATHLKETFNVDGMAQHIKFDVPPDHITFGGDLGTGTGNHQINNTPTAGANARKLSFLGTAGADGTPSVDPTTGVTAEPLPAYYQSILAKVPGLTRDQLIQKLQHFYPEIDANGDGQITNDELDQAHNTGVFPPARPDNKMAQFLAGIDPRIHRGIAASNTTDNGVYDTTMREVTRLSIELLKSIYPERTFSDRPASESTATGGQGWWTANQIKMNGQIIQLYGSNSNGDPRGQASVNYYDPTPGQGWGRYASEGLQTA